MLELMMIGLIAIGSCVLINAIKSEEPADLDILITELNREAYEVNKKRVYEMISRHKQIGSIDCWVNINFPQIKRELRLLGYRVYQVNNNLYEISWK